MVRPCEVDRSLATQSLSFMCLRMLVVWLCTMLINNSAICEVGAVIRFLNAKNIHPAEIHWQLVEVYGNNVVMNDGNCISGVGY